MSFRGPLADGDPQAWREMLEVKAAGNAILDAALRMFGQYGYRRTSMDDIAGEAGIGKGTIYLSFAGKEEVFVPAPAYIDAP